MRSFVLSSAPATFAVRSITNCLEAILADNFCSLYLLSETLPKSDFDAPLDVLPLLCFTKAPMHDLQSRQVLMLRQLLESAYPENLYFRRMTGVILPAEALLAQKASTMILWEKYAQYLTEDTSHLIPTLAQFIGSSRLISGSNICAWFEERYIRKSPPDMPMAEHP